MAKHGKRLTVTGVLGAALAFVLLALFTGALNAMGSKVVDLSHGFFSSAKPTPSPRLPVEIQVETDVTKVASHAHIWTAPREVKLPVFAGSCGGINDWGVREPKANDTDPVVRVTLTGNAPTNVVVQRVWPQVIERTMMPSGWIALSCPIGGPIDAIVASLSLDNPSQTDYQDANQYKMDHLAYSLQKGEAGVFYAQVFNDHKKTTWDLMMELTVGNVSKVVNVNAENLGGRHFVTNATCGTQFLSWEGHHWTDNGITNC